MRRTCFLILFALSVVLPARAEGQVGTFSVLGSGGQGRDIVGSFVGSLELRWEALESQVSPFADASVRLFENPCDDSLPPGCGLPGTGAVQVSGGVLGGRDLGTLTVFIAPSVGVMRWGGDWDPTARLGTGLRFGIGPRLELETGVRAEWIWISERTTSVRTSERRFDSLSLVLGLRFGS